MSNMSKIILGISSGVILVMFVLILLLLFKVKGT